MFGLSAAYVSILRGRARTDDSAGLVHADHVDAAYEEAQQLGYEIGRP